MEKTNCGIPATDKALSREGSLRILAMVVLLGGRRENDGGSGSLYLTCPCIRAGRLLR